MSDKRVRVICPVCVKIIATDWIEPPPIDGATIVGPLTSDTKMKMPEHAQEPGWRCTGGGSQAQVLSQNWVETGPL